MLPKTRSLCAVTFEISAHTNESVYWRASHLTVEALDYSISIYEPCHTHSCDKLRTHVVNFPGERFLSFFAGTHFRFILLGGEAAAAVAADSWSIRSRLVRKPLPLKRRLVNPCPSQFRTPIRRRPQDPLPPAAAASHLLIRSCSADPRFPSVTTGACANLIPHIRNYVIASPASLPSHLISLKLNHTHNFYLWSTAFLRGSVLFLFTVLVLFDPRNAQIQYLQFTECNIAW